MYRPHAKADYAVLDTGATVTPVATLKDEWGGVAHIIEDDHCYVLILNQSSQQSGTFRMSTHWFPEAVDALKTLPTPRMP